MRRDPVGELGRVPRDALARILEERKGIAGVEIQEAAHAATVQQTANAAEVSRAIQGISQVTEQSAAGSEAMASSSEELGAQADTLRSLVGEFTVETAP